ncbi:hypothetical protein F4553_000292 [Allocatelliglobosispora scoriae]|uniref:PASTA domain-containing protein n=1 Tax=Allocatelliglobosispora scoriae TaxID=643052 RepID=A0A841BIM8_9ACTN|nr:PASTA domain-containing protein [Allocatelliglobosispora scoriae]MBB5866913.1 hypothetical protein [Allocatelliglobosispora scoriae]
MRVALRVVLYVTAIAVLAACVSKGKDGTAAGSPEPVASAAASPSDEPSAEPSPSDAADPTPSPTPSPRATSAAPAKDTLDFAMPDFKGSVLQDAQDAVQELGIFYSTSHDLRGSRNQLIDSNWRVCTQSPRAGTRVRGKAADYEGKIDFGVVKLTESCP